MVRPMFRDGGEIGVVTQGSLTEGVEMKLNPDRSVEDVKAGKFVVIDGYKNQFFSMITDLSLDATNPEILLYPPREGDQLLHSVPQMGPAPMSPLPCVPCSCWNRGKKLSMNRVR